ncbi:MAG: hypothetical protein ACHQT9_02850, partial [Candidatus Saccharimonadales bacterium]
VLAFALRLEDQVAVVVPLPTTVRALASVIDEESFVEGVLLQFPSRDRLQTLRPVRHEVAGAIGKVASLEDWRKIKETGPEPPQPPTTPGVAMLSAA